MSHFSVRTASNPVQRQRRQGEARGEGGGARPSKPGMKNNVPALQEQEHGAMSIMNTEKVLKVPMKKPKEVLGHVPNESISVEKY